jgi:hypothetical protein
MGNYPSQGEQNVFDHIFESYFNLRTGIAVLAILFPLVLWLGGKLIGIELRYSMSAYYLEIDGKTMRDWFVGILWAIGVLSRNTTASPVSHFSCYVVTSVSMSMIPWRFALARSASGQSLAW